jgi:CBS domain-containing protein
MPRLLADAAFLDATLHVDDTVEEAVRTLLSVEVPALPVVDVKGRYRGVFGEREFMAALFPGYVQQLKGAAFLTGSIDHALEKRDSCRRETIERHVLTEHVEVGPDFSDVALAEIFLHHQVAVVPVVDDGRLVGIVSIGDAVKHKMSQLEFERDQLDSYVHQT